MNSFELRAKINVLLVSFHLFLISCCATPEQELVNLAVKFAGEIAGSLFLHKFYFILPPSNDTN